MLGASRSAGGHRAVDAMEDRRCTMSRATTLRAACLLCGTALALIGVVILLGY
jgi:hypothetical protein